MTIAKQTAIVYCENQFGLVDGKTASGLIRHSDTYTILGVIDSRLKGQDAGEVLGIKDSNIPIFASLEDALENLNTIPDCYIYGKAPLEASIPVHERVLILEAMQKGMNIINGLHQFFSEDLEFVQAAKKYGIKIKDVRKPPQLSDSHIYAGNISKVNIPVIAILGTDCACGKMTTAVELNKALNSLGIKSVMVATGQTSIMQGAKYGVTMDALVSQFVIGEVEHAVVQAFEQENPDIILVEGQSALSHPAFMSSVGILKGSMPDGIILQHPPSRVFRCDFPNLPMPTLESEIKLIEAFSQSQIIAIALSHENMTAKNILKVVDEYEAYFKLPTTDVLTDGCQKLIQSLCKYFPKLGQKIKQEYLPKTPVLAS
jgi:uncharacterized NAD-dependent epimerase/dehydratase family protein